MYNLENPFSQQQVVAKHVSSLVYNRTSYFLQREVYVSFVFEPQYTCRIEGEKGKQIFASRKLILIWQNNSSTKAGTSYM